MDTRVEDTAKSMATTLHHVLVAASGESFNYFALIGIVPQAMELAAQNATLSGEERKEVVVQAILLMLDRAPSRHYGDISKEELMQAARVGIPLTVDLLYAAYRHRHTFRRTAARTWVKVKACFGRCKCCCSSNVNSV